LRGGQIVLAAILAVGLLLLALSSLRALWQPRSGRLGAVFAVERRSTLAVAGIGAFGIAAIDWMIVRMA
jgi:hypothetical protein